MSSTATFKCERKICCSSSTGALQILVWGCPSAELLIPWSGVNLGRKQSKQQSHNQHWEVWRWQQREQLKPQSKGLVFVKNCWGALADPQLGRQSEGGHFLSNAGHLHRARKTQGNNFTRNKTLLNPIMAASLENSTRKNSNESQQITTDWILFALISVPGMGSLGAQGWIEATDRFLQWVNCCSHCHVNKSAASGLISVALCWIYTWEQQLTLSTWSERGLVLLRQSHLEIFQLLLIGVKARSTMKEYILAWKLNQIYLTWVSSLDR